MFFLTGLSQESNGDIMQPMVGGQKDPNNCLIGAGYSWCESSKSCIRQWETPCLDNFNDCSDCLKRQRNGENIACPIDCDITTRSDCLLDSDCDNTHFCRPYTMNVDGPKECVPFSNEGESCGGYTLPSHQSRCVPSLECANVMGPMIADAPGQCMRFCKTNTIRDSYGNCNQIRGGVMEPGPMVPSPSVPVLTHCEPCLPPAPCPMPAPGCNYTPELPDDCGCITGCGRIDCYAIDPMPPMVNPSASIPVAAAAGGRCASGFCENQSDCPQCAAGSTCSVQPGMMCAGTCYGTCSMPPSVPVPVCSDVMCMMYCNNGYVKDNNGCDICQCNEPIPPIPPIHPVDPIIPEPPDSSCIIPYIECNNIYACAKVTEITSCSIGGIDGYVTYQLSIRLKPNKNIKNIFAVYGSNIDNTPMLIPKSKQLNDIYGSNVGGIAPGIININPESRYDSWLTIGTTDGNINNNINTIGIPFETWNDHTDLIISDGAIFLMNPNQQMDIGNDIVIAQLTIPINSIETGYINIQGKFIDDKSSWIEENIDFTLQQSNILSINNIPINCISWYDGCNTCTALYGVINSCTKLMCFINDDAYCLEYSNGH